MLYFIHILISILNIEYRDEVKTMARCPMLTAASGWFTVNEYSCDLTGLKMDADSPKVKFVCNCESGYEYEKCPVYQSR